MKKKISTVCCLLAAFTAVASFAGCKKDAEENKAETDLINEIGGCSETYEGGVSETAYQKEDDAAEAFVRNELLGSDMQTQLTVAEPQSITKDEAAKIIPAAFTKDAVEFKKVEVTYTQAANEANAQATFLSTDKAIGNAQTKKVTVYLIKYGEEWKYFTPKVEVGNAVTKSYYDSIFNAEKYKNCTMESVVTSGTHVSYEGTTIDMSITMKTVSKYAENGIYTSITSEVNASGNNDAAVEAAKSSMAQSAVNMEYYVSFGENNVSEIYLRMGDATEWRKGDIVSINAASLEDLYPFVNQYVDYTFFTKTETGCAVENDSLKDYYNQVFSSLGNSLDMNVDNGYVKYYVSGGALSAIMLDITISMNVMGYTYQVKATNTTKVTNYGTTVVARPEGVPAPAPATDAE